MEPRKVIISAALTGAITPKSICPAIPLTPEEIAADAVACARAGAASVHIHVRDEQARPTMETSYFVEAFEAIKDACRKEGVDLIVNLTTSNCPASDELRLAHLRAIRPEMCSFDAGTMNWGKNIFENSPRFLDKLAETTMELDIKPEVEVFDGSMIDNALRMVKRGQLKAPLHFQFVLGVEGGLAGNLSNLNFLLSKLPADATWSITGIGKAHIPMMLGALAADCTGLRVGLEDNVMLAKGVPATNVQLVERAAELIRLSGAQVATAEEARAMLNIGRKSW